jgi:hypothetical protein
VTRLIDFVDTGGFSVTHTHVQAEW